MLFQCIPPCEMKRRVLMIWSRLLLFYGGIWLTSGVAGGIICLELALVAQLDRVSDSDSEGRTFESCRAHHIGAGFASLAPTFFSKARAQSRRRSSLPNRARFAGLGVEKEERRFYLSTRHHMGILVLAAPFQTGGQIGDRKDVIPFLEKGRGKDGWASAL